MKYRITLTCSGTVTVYDESMAFWAKQYASSLMNDGIAFSFELVKA